MKTPAWQRKEGKNPEGGLNAKGRAVATQSVSTTSASNFSGGVNASAAVIIDKTGSTIGRMRLFVGDGTGSTVADDNYIGNLNTDLHIRAGTAGLVETFVFSLDGNLFPKVAAKGINFTANTGAAGKTSQLLNWYEEGTWTPTFTGWAIAPTLFYAQYTRIGRQVTVNIYAQGGTSSYTAIGGLPFTANAAQGSAGVINSSNAAVLYGCSIVPSGSTIQGINMVMGANYWQLTITYFV